MLGYSIYVISEKQDTSKDPPTTKENDLTLKFPLQLPYVTGWQSSELSDEEILRGNEYYKIISKEIVQDTLIVHCEFSQTSRERFWTLVSNFDDQSNAHRHRQQEETGKLMKNFLKEYLKAASKHTFYLFEWCITSLILYFETPVATPAIFVASPPPDLFG